MLPGERAMNGTKEAAEVPRQRGYGVGAAPHAKSGVGTDVDLSTVLPSGEQRSRCSPDEVVQTADT